MADPTPLAPTGKVPTGKPCAVCGKPALQRYKPFCSARCADIDLGRWLKGSYVIPGKPLDEAESAPGGGERDDD